MDCFKIGIAALLGLCLVACSGDMSSAPEFPEGSPGPPPPVVPVDDPWGDDGIDLIDEVPTPSEETDPEEAPDEGRIAYNMPREMVLGRSYFAEILIQPFEDGAAIEEVDQALLDQLGITENIDPSTDEVPLIETIETTNEMSVEIRANGAEVIALTDVRQATASGDTTPWLWEVTPTRAGAFKLTVIVYQFQMSDAGETRRIAGIKQFDATVISEADLLAVRTPARVGPPEAIETASPMPEGESLTWSSGCETTYTNADTNRDRWALVISNQDYTASVGPLANTHLDNQRLGEALQKTRFNIIQCRDVGALETRNALSRFAREIDQQIDASAEPVAFFYYSGHGINLGGRNYMVPVDMPDINETTIETYGVGFDEVLNRIWFPNESTSFAVFDACRNVYGRSKGLQPIVAHATGAGLFQAFATAPGKVAADNGYYSEALSSVLPEAGLRAEMVFNRVQDTVAERTGFTQIPFNNDGIAGEFYFVEP